MNIKNTKFYSKENRNGFTLVELIIVITILAVLATIAFISFKNYSWNSRDSNKMTTLKNLQTGLELFALKTGNYPEPENATLITGSGWVHLFTQWNFWDTIAKQIQAQWEIKDPLTKDSYSYGIAADKQTYQLATFLENNLSSLHIPWIETTYANSPYYAYVVWNYKPTILIFNSGSYLIPSLILQSPLPPSWALPENPYYVVKNEQNLPYSPNVNIPTNNTEVLDLGIIKDLIEQLKQDESLNETEIKNNITDLINWKFENNNENKDFLEKITEITQKWTPWNNPNSWSPSEPEEPESPSTPEESCFEVNESWVITNYYNNIWNNPNNTACSKNITIPWEINGIQITSIWANAFQNKGLVSVALSDSINTIWNHAFESNELTSIIIGNNITTIWISSFQNNQLTSITLGTNLTSIWGSAFQNNKLTSLNLGNNVTSIWYGTFQKNLLTSVNIPNNVTTIWPYAFNDNKLVNATIGTGLTSLQNGVFGDNELS